MDFEIVHEFDADRERVERAMFDPKLAEYLRGRMTLVREIEVLARSDDAAAISRRVRYVPVPMIGKVGTVQVKPEWMSWVEISRFDRQGHRIEYSNVPTVPRIAELLEQRGAIHFEEAGPGRTRRIIRGSLTIKMPIVGRVAEKMIFPNARKILDEEANVFASWLAARTS